MLNRLVKKSITNIEKHIPMSEQQKNLCAYGLDLLLYTIISTLGLMAIGFLFQMPCQAGIIVLTFYINQSAGGGFHAHSHFSCFLTMAVGLIISLLTIQHPWSVSILLPATIIACSLLFTNPLVLHPNKSYLKEKSLRLIRRSKAITLIELIVSLMLIFGVRETVSCSYAVGLLASAISRMVAVLQRR